MLHVLYTPCSVWTQCELCEILSLDMRPRSLDPWSMILDMMISNITVCTHECWRVAGIVGMPLRVPWYRVCTNVLYNTNATPCMHDAGDAGDDTYDRS